jgi:Bacterial capsule synthesis protein PGA_cap
MTRFTIAAVVDVALLRPPGADLFRAGWDEADVRIANLEAPLTQGGIPAAKLIRLQSPPEAAAWLRDDLGCDVVSLANNHIMDWGTPPSRPYHAPERPENRDTFIALFTVAPSNGRLAVHEARFRLLPGAARAPSAPAPMLCGGLDHHPPLDLHRS